MRRNLTAGSLLCLMIALGGCPSAPPTVKPRVLTSHVAALTPSPFETISNLTSPTPDASPTAHPSPSPTASATATPGATASVEATGAYHVTTLAGNDTSGLADGVGANALFDGPNGIDIGPDGTLYVADTGNNAIRKVKPDGTVTTLAGGTSGNLDGAGKAARLHSPFGVAVAPDGTVYVADTSNNIIRKIGTDGYVTTIAGSVDTGLVDDIGQAARFNQPFSLALDSKGLIYVADAGNHAIRKIDASNLAHVVVTTVAGGAPGSLDGPLAKARFNTPNDVAFGPTGLLYVADFGNNALRVIDLTAATVSTLAGSGVAGFRDGTGTDALFNAPTGLTVGVDGNIYVSDNQNQRIRATTPLGVVTTLAGERAAFADGIASVAMFYEPTDLVQAKDHTLYVADTKNNRIRAIKRGP